MAETAHVAIVRSPTCKINALRVWLFPGRFPAAVLFAYCVAGYRDITQGSPLVINAMAYAWSAQKKRPIETVLLSTI